MWASHREHKKRDEEVDRFRVRTIGRQLQSEVCVFDDQTLQRHSRYKSMCGNKKKTNQYKIHDLKNENEKKEFTWWSHERKHKSDCEQNRVSNGLPSGHADITFDSLNTRCSSHAHKIETSVVRLKSPGAWRWLNEISWEEKKEEKKRS